MRRQLRSKRNLNTSSIFVLKNQTKSLLVHFYSVVAVLRMSLCVWKHIMSVRFLSPRSNDILEQWKIPYVNVMTGGKGNEMK